MHACMLIAMPVETDIFYNSNESKLLNNPKYFVVPTLGVWCGRQLDAVVVADKVADVGQQVAREKDLEGPGGGRKAFQLSYHAPELRAHQFANGASAGLTEPDPDLVSVRPDIC